MNRSPRSGGVYSYTKEAFGRDHAFLSSWFLCLSYLTIVFLNSTALFVIFRTMFGDLTQKRFHYTVSGNTIYIGEILLSAAALAGVGLLFILARKILHKIHTVLSLILFGGIMILTLACLPHLSLDVLGAFGSQNSNILYGIFSITFLAPWAFAGFEVISFDTQGFLISNAHKFTPEGGSVSVSISEIGNDDGYGNYEIRVRDNGIGMSKEFSDKMFTPFERERTSTASGLEGTGLGLPISKSIIDLMGGTIDVHTSPGSGTEIVLALKFRLADENEFSKKEPMTEKTAKAVDLSSKRLLPVEDNTVNMEIAKMILTQAGFTVETAENGQVGLDMVKAFPDGYYDAILMDIQTPVMDGYTAARRIRALDNKSHANIPILAMTANAFKEDEEKAKEARNAGTYRQADRR